MKRFLFCSILCLLLFSAAGCSNNNSTIPEQNTVNLNENETNNTLENNHNVLIVYFSVLEDVNTYGVDAEFEVLG